MGRGSYLGGSTIVNLRRDGWSGPERKKVNKKRKKKSKSPEQIARLKAERELAFELETRKYARLCGISFLSGEARPRIPKKLRDLLGQLEQNKEDFQSSISSHEAFKIDNTTRQDIFNKKAKDFAEQSAISFFKSGTILELTDSLKIMCSSEELFQLKNDIRENFHFQKKISYLKKQADRARKRNEKQKEKMAKIVVEYVQRK